MGGTTPAGLAWRALATLLAPALRLHLRRRAGRGKEIAARLPERRGHGAARPPGPLVWLHAASVGETLSILPLLDAMADAAPGLHLLVTTGTVTSAELLGRRLPPDLAGRVTHRFVPLDVPGWVARFLDGWRPDCGVLVESELWPNLLAAAAARRIPLALVNARFSPRAAARWRRAPGLARRLLGGFALVAAQTPADAARLAARGAAAPLCLGNLKDSAPPLPADPAALAALRAAIGDRPVLLGAATHPGEETLLAAAAALLRRDRPDLLTILVPRHPERGAALAAELGLATRRSQGALPGQGESLHLADTLGELGVFYRLATVCVVGGSLVPHGGQNPREPARLGCPMLFGPHMANFADPVARLLAAGGARQVAPDPAALAAAAAAVISSPGIRHAMAAAAERCLAGTDGLPARLAGLLLGLLPAGAVARAGVPDRADTAPPADQPAER